MKTSQKAASSETDNNNNDRITMAKSIVINAKI